jgi:hypothetical protein
VDAVRDVKPAAMIALARRRQASLRLIGPRCASPAAVVEHLGAVQSQDYGPALWSIAQRLDGAGFADVERAVTDGALLRTHVLRPTWHFVRPADLRWMLALTAPRIARMAGYQDRKLGLDAKTMGRACAAIARALEGGAHLTRRELQAALARAKITGTGQRIGHVLMNAELAALIVSGASRGKQQTYALLDDRVPPSPAIDRDDALARLATRYFTSHGPATAKDLTWWASLTLADVARGIAAAGRAIVREEHAGVAYYAGAAAPPPPPSRTRVAHLLQAYDEYVVGYSESKYLLDASGDAREAVRTSARGMFNFLFALDTQIAGRWQRTIAKDAVAITILPHAALDAPARRAIDAAAARFGAFLGLSARVTVTDARMARLRADPR